MTLLEQQQENLVDAVELGIMLGISRDYVTRLYKRGRLPKTVRPIHRNMRWLANDIEVWLSLGRPSQKIFERWRGIED